jgi:hypothetical protein
LALLSLRHVRKASRGALIEAWSAVKVIDDAANNMITEPLPRLPMNVHVITLFRLNWKHLMAALNG